MKKNKEAIKMLRRAYNNLARSINATADLAVYFGKNKDKRANRVERTSALIMKAQEILNVLAEDEDIGIV